MNQPAKKATLANILLMLGLALVLAVECYCGYQLHRLSAEQERIKEDYAMFNNITFGVFSIDLWREKIAGIITQKIDGFEIEPDEYLNNNFESNKNSIQ
ncbi:MAG: hypothetical protein EOP48_34865 [Sphingobacteriales bacterium]|nr:MAG: hypothetical protein EOP48_34865 [Sphingobacteriales bacterium]